MEIELINFRCHSNYKITLPEKGLTLLKAKSGSGKTSLVMGIIFCLFGKGKKVVKIGQKSATVTIKFKGFTIKRISSPKELFVYNLIGDKFENDEAQSIIYNQILKCNSSEEFIQSSYAEQNAYNSIINMTPTVRLEFIQNLTCIDNFHKKFKKTLIDYQSQISAQMAQLQGSIDATKKSMEMFKIENPDENLTLQSVENEMIDNNVILAELNKNKKILEQHKQDLIKKIDQIKNQLKTFKSSTEEIKHLSDLQLKTEKEIEELYYDEEIIDELDKKINYLQLKQKLDNSTQELKEFNDKIVKELDELYDSPDFIDVEDYNKLVLQVKNQKKIKEDHEQIKKQINSNEEKLKEQNQKLKKMNVDPEINLQDLKNEIEQLSIDFHKAELSSKSLKCSWCEKSLILQNDKLIKFDGSNVSVNPQEIKKTLKMKQDLFETLPIILKTIEECTKIKELLILPDINFIESTQVLEKRIEKNNSIYSKIDYREDETNFSSQRNKMEQEIKNVTDKLKLLTPQESNDSIDELKKLLFNETSKKVLNDSLNSSLKQMMSKIVDLKIKNVKNNYDELENELNSFETSFHETELEIKNNQQEIDKSTEKKIIINSKFDIVKFNDLKISLDNDRKVYHELNKENVNVTKLLSLIKKAEIYSLENAVNRINDGAVIYLQQLFEDPIEVKIKSEKIDIHTKEPKTQISPYITFKGNEFDNVDVLSGGEKQRVELAFLLSMNDIIGSSMIILDECLNNLDCEINMKTLNFLKDNSINKLILVISHEAVDGVFDHVINI